jgi:hypothetical protein
VAWRRHEAVNSDCLLKVARRTVTRWTPGSDAACACQGPVGAGLIGKFGEPGPEAQQIAEVGRANLPPLVVRASNSPKVRMSQELNGGGQESCALAVTRSERWRPSELPRVGRCSAVRGG